MTQAKLFAGMPEVLSPRKKAKAKALAKSRQSKIKKAKDARSDDINQIWNYWRDRSGSGRPKIGNAAKEKISGRLAEGYTVAQICAGIDAMVDNPWWIGNCKRTMSKVCESGDRLDGFIEQGRPKTQQEQLAQLAKDSPMIAGTIMADQHYRRQQEEYHEYNEPAGYLDQGDD
jgi:hypothetical protein